MSRGRHHLCRPQGRRRKRWHSKSHIESGCRSRIRVRGERKLCANASDHNQRNTDIRGWGSVCRRNGPGGDESLRHELAAANSAEQQSDGDAAGEGSLLGCREICVPAVDEFRLTEKQGLIIRPMVTIVNSVPHFDQSGRNERTAGSARPFSHLRCRVRSSAAGSRSAQARRSSSDGIGGSRRARTHGRWGLMREPCCSARTSSPTPSCSNGSRSGKRRGREPHDRNVQLHLLLGNGFTIGTQPNLSVDWEAPEDKRVAFSIGPQIGKLCRCGGMPTLFQLQVQYYPVRPDVSGPKWNIQLQATLDDSGPHQESALLTRGPPF